MDQTKKVKVSTKARAQFGAALLFMMMGFGNIIFGHSKTDYYLSLLQENNLPKQTNEDAQLEDSLSESPTSLNVETLMFPEISRDKREQHVKRVRSRLQYYKIAILGGKVFLAIAGVFLLSMLITLRMDEKQLTSS